MIGKIVLTSALACVLSGVAVAQTLPETAAAPATPAADARPWAARSAVSALRGAYRAIADAQVYGASPYLDAAKTHYRGALARYQRQDAGAASEAMAATALARAAVAEHPAPVPRDLPPPPAEVAQPAPARDGRPMMRPGHMDGGRRSWRFDATRLASDVKLAGTSEARDLGQKALDADVARTRASFDGNADEAMRQGRLAGALAMAVRALAYADHPPAFDRSRMQQRDRQRPGGNASTFGATSD